MKEVDDGDENLPRGARSAMKEALEMRQFVSVIKLPHGSVP